jgi:hypothetical protein
MGYPVGKKEQFPVCTIGCHNLIKESIDADLTNPA